MSEPRLPNTESISPEMSLMIPLFLCVFVGHHVDGEGVINGCLSAIAAGLGRLRWTTDAVTRGRSASSTLGRVVSCIATVTGIQLDMQSCVGSKFVSRTEVNTAMFSSYQPSRRKNIGL